MKKVIRNGFLCFVVLGFFVTINNKQLGNRAVALAVNDDITTKVEESVINQLEEFDYGELENFFETEIDEDVFEKKTLKEILKDMVLNDENFGIDKVWQLVVEKTVGEIGTVLKLVALIVAIVGFGAFSQLLEEYTKKGSGIASVINFFILTLILSIVAKVIADFIGDTTDLLYKIKKLMEIIFPLLLSLLITIGGTSVSKNFEPAVVVLTGGVIEILVYLTTTVVSIYLVLSVLGELSKAVKLNNLKIFIISTYKWTLGLIFTIFMGYLSLSGITASSSDKISIKTAKYALKSYIPLVGGYVSDSYEIFRVGSVLLKNSIGVIGVVLLFSLIVGKVLTLIVYNLGFKLASGLSEPIATNKISGFLSSLSTIFNLLIAGIVACFLMCSLTLLIIISTANIA